MIDVIRLVSVYPVFVHFTLGSLPVLLLTYAIAARSRVRFRSLLIVL
jgi:hypothetical protein